MKKLSPVKEIVSKLQRFHNQAQMLMVLGSGWNQLSQEIDLLQAWAYQDIFGTPAGVTGHAGKLMLGKINQKLIWIMAGRFHTYEGYSSHEVTVPIQAFSQLGVNQVVITSAAGGLNDQFRVGDIVVLSDILALFCPSPLLGPQFQDLSTPFSAELRERVITACQKQQIPLQHQGVYAYIKGPHYESFADKKALKNLGADCVGMSTVPETIMAHALGMQVLGLSCITNLAFVKHSHQEVVENAQQVAHRMTKLLKAIVV